VVEAIWLKSFDCGFVCKLALQIGLGRQNVVRDGAKKNAPLFDADKGAQGHSNGVACKILRIF
jgi:hypothetical protein